MARSRARAARGAGGGGGGGAGRRGGAGSRRGGEAGGEPPAGCRAVLSRVGPEGLGAGAAERRIWPSRSRRWGRCSGGG